MRALLPPLWLALCAAAPIDELVPERYVDPRIRTVPYSADEVVPVAVPPGYQLTVELGRGEQVESIAIGDSGGWLVTPNKRGDFLFIKPLDGARTTNLTVVTDARTYLFEVAAGGSMDLPYALRFRYDDKETPAAEAPVPRPPGRFRLGGARAIRPAEMFDDGRKTFIVPKPDQPLPAVFAIGADGSETLLNGAMRGGRYVVDGLANRFVLRLDSQAVIAVRKPKLRD